MATIDQERGELGLVVVLLGGANQKFLNGLPIREGELRLGAVHGYTPRLKFHSFSVDPWANNETAELEKVLPHADALVLTDDIREGTHYSSAALERLVRSARQARVSVPAAIFGGPALREEWATLSGSQPVFTGEPEGTNAAGALKALLKILLKKIAPDGTTSPPPSIG